MKPLLILSIAINKLKIIIYIKLVYEAKEIENILIGSAAIIMMGRSQTTGDINLLIFPYIDIPILLHSLQKKGVLSVIDGNFYIILNID